MPRCDTESKSNSEEQNVCVEKMRKLLSENVKLTVLQGCDEAYLKRFLYSTDFIVEDAFKKMQMFYDVLEKHPEWFTMIAPSSKRNIIEQGTRILTNIHDKQGRPIYIMKIGNVNPSTMDFISDLVPVDDFFMELLLTTDLACKNGLCIIIDISNFPWSLLKWLTPRNIKTSVKRIQSMPFKEYKIHIVNSSRLISVAVNTVWPFLPKHIKDGVIFHYEDWDSLHKYVDKELLSTEFGGNRNEDYRAVREQLYERDLEIALSLKNHRLPYLKHSKHIEKQLAV